jgi:hypothetical protein
MELFSRLGIAAEIRARGVAAGYPFNVIFASSMAGREFARWGPTKR